MLRCSKCGEEMGAEKDHCPNCGYQEEPSVQVLTPQERENFQGMTILDEDSESNTYSEKRRINPNPRIHVRQIHINSSGITGFLPKLFLLAAVLIIVFVFLPMVLMFIAAGVLGWFVLRLLKK